MAEKNNQNTHPDNVGIPYLCIYLHPIPSGLLLLASPALGNPASVLCLLSPVFCLLPMPPACPGVALCEAGCLVPIPPVLPIMPILPQPYFLCVLGDLCGVRAIMQNKPNLQNPRNNAKSSQEKTYDNIMLHPTQKKQSQSNPISPRRHTTSDIPHTKYEGYPLPAKHFRNRLKDRPFSWYNHRLNPYRSAWNPLADEKKWRRR